MKRSKRTLLIACLVMSAGCAAQADNAPQKYQVLRTNLIAQGYTPFRVLTPGTPAYRMAIYNRGDVYARFPEVEACGGTGLADCEFVLAHGNDVIVIHTTGETPDTLRVADIRHTTPAQAAQLYNGRSGSAA